MQVKHKAWLALMLFLLPITLFAAPADDIKDLASVMNSMTAIWNKGDLKSFLSFYKNDDSTIYVSSTILAGYKNIAKRYITHYPTKQSMGKLAISNLQIKLLPPSYAMTIGNWKLEREGMSNAEGVFSVLCEKTSEGWKIIVDHTS